MENNWTINQTKKLFALTLKASGAGHGLIKAFAEMAAECGKSVNSVRNYYYSQLKMFELVPKLAVDLGITLPLKQRQDFETFTKAAITGLIKQILLGKAKGESVRAVIAGISGGDAKKALRLQNKYRSMVSHHKTAITAIMHELAEQNVPYYNPYLKETLCGKSDDNHKKLGDYIASLNSGEVDEFLTLMKKLFV